MRSDFRHLLGWAAGVPWAIDQTYAQRMLSILEMRLTDTQPDAETRQRLILEADARLSARTAQTVQAGPKQIAVLPMLGTLTYRLSALSEVSGAGGTSIAGFSRSFTAAINDSNVAAVVIAIGSPGGEVSGVPEAAQLVYEARFQKPVTAVADCLACSAAYWIGSQASEFIASSSADVGSIGVFCAHENIARMLERLGVEPTLIHAGRFKVENSSYGPLTAEARDALQKRVNQVYAAFTRDVARGRGVAVDAVRRGFGEGRSVSAADAVKLGMADRVATLAQVVEEQRRKLMKAAPRTASASAYTAVAISAERAGFLRRRARHRARMTT